MIKGPTTWAKQVRPLMWPMKNAALPLDTGSEDETLPTTKGSHKEKETMTLMLVLCQKGRQSSLRDFGPVHAGKEASA